MTDVFTKEKRSAVMSRIRGRGNERTEVALAKLLRGAGIKGWRRHVSILGKPDFLFRKERVVIFVDGCFWHGCPKHSNTPVNNRDFWLKKLTRNKDRDANITRTLRQRGWCVVRIWEHDLKQGARVVRRLQALLQRRSKPEVKPETRLYNTSARSMILKR